MSGLCEEEKTKLEAQERIKKEKDAQKVQRGWLGCLGFLGFIVIIAILSNLPSTEEKNHYSPLQEKKSLEYMLAAVNARGYVREDDITIRRFRTLLDQLDEKFVEGREQIGDMTVKGVQMLDQAGIEEKPLNIMEGLNSVFFTKIENQRYAEYVAIYVTAREKGMSHEEAIKDLRNIITALTSR